MDTHYNAFISYNHNPRDMKIVEMLMNKLERYRIPKEIRESSGINSIDRIFVDKGELGVSSDLNEVIQNALRNSDYLIVICSPESNASPWVHREIEFFLKYHDIHNVLTVLTAGEPQDVIPQELILEETVEEEGKTYTRKLEPLSADYRLPVREADQAELPRLVSALLGCKYDDLVQRQKRYRRKRLAIMITALSAVIIAAFAYLLWSNHEISTYYQSALAEQSRTMIEQSEKALADGDRIEAIRFAIKALPFDEQDRPLISEAIFALTKAVGFYQPPSNTWLRASRVFDDMVIYDTMEKDSELYIVGISDGDIRFCNAQTGGALLEDQLYELQDSEGSIEELTFYGDDKLLIFVDDYEDTSDRLTIVSLEDGSVLRTLALDKMSFNGTAVIIDDQLWMMASTPKGAEASVRIIESDDETEFEDEEDEDIFLEDWDEEDISPEDWDEEDIEDIIDIYGECKLVAIDLNEGKVTHSYSMYQNPNPELVVHEESGIAVSNDERYLAARFSTYDNSDSYDSDYSDLPMADKVKLIDLMNGSDTELTEDSFIADAAFSGTGDLVLCQIESRPRGLFGVMYSADRNIQYSTASAVRRNIHLKAVDMASNETRWERSYQELFIGAPWLANDVVDDQIVLTAGCNFHAIDENGEESLGIKFDSPVVTYYSLPTRTQVPQGDRSYAYDPCAVLYSGQTGEYVKELDIVLYTDVFAAPVYSAEVIGDKFLIEGTSDRDETTLKTRLYTYTGTDDRWEVYPQSSRGKLPEDIFSYKEDFLEYSDEHASLLTLLRRNSHTGAVVWEKSYDITAGDFWHDCSPLGIDPERGKWYILIGYETDLDKLIYLEVDLETGEAEQMSLNIPREIFASDMLLSTYDNGELRALVIDTDEEPMTGSIVSWKPGDEDSLVMKPLRGLPEESYGIDNLARTDGKSYYLIIDDELMVFGADGSLKAGPVTVPESSGLSAPEGDYLYVMYWDYESNINVIYQYLKSDLSLVEQANMGDHLIMCFDSSSYVEKLSPDELLIVSSPFVGEAIIAGTDGLVVRAELYCSAYNPEAREFYVIDQDDTIGHFAYLTLDEMIYKAMAIAY